MLFSGRLKNFSGLLCVSLLLAATTASADEVIVLTSYPEEMTTVYEQAFAKAHPDTHLRIVWQQGRDAMATLHKPDHGGIDVYWAPAAYNFPTLASEGLFQPFKVDRAAVPGRIGVQAISDPQGRFEAFEVAGYGLAVNPAVLEQKKIVAPISWDDLAKPAFKGLVVLPVPKQVGFAPTLYDIILQDKGWDQGWALLSEIAANARLAEKGMQIIGPVIDGDAGVSLAIDFLIRNAIAEGQPLKLIYPRRTAFLPAYAAVIKGTPHAAAAQTFNDFIFSAEGQQLLFHHDVNRYPVRPTAYAAGPKGVVNPFNTPAEATFQYDQSIGPARAPLISAVFEAAISVRAAKLQELWSAIHAAEKKGVTPATKEARALAGWVPVSAHDAADAAFAGSVAAMKPGQAPDPRLKDWIAAMDEKQARALALVSSSK